MVQTSDSLQLRVLLGPENSAMFLQFAEICKYELSKYLKQEVNSQKHNQQSFLFDYRRMWRNSAIYRTDEYTAVYHWVELCYWTVYYHLFK